MRGGDWMHGMPMMNGHGWMVLALFGVLVFLAVVLLAIGRSSGRRGAQPPEKTPLDILKERYARGEIDRQEYERMKRDLE